MGCRKDARLAQSQPPSGKGFRGVDCEHQSVGLHRLCAVAHQKISLTLTRSQVSYTTITIKIRTLSAHWLLQCHGAAEVANGSACSATRVCRPSAGYRGKRALDRERPLFFVSLMIRFT